MSAFAAPFLQQAVFDRLQNSTHVMNRVSDVYDEATENAVSPFVTFGDTRHQPYDTGTTEGAIIHFDILVWSNTPHQMEAKEVMALIDDELHLMNITVTDYTLVRLVLASADVTKQQREGSVYARGRMTYKCVLFKN